MSDLKLKGSLGASLNRNVTQIKRDRALSVYEQLELFYKRKIEDMEVEMKSLIRKREARLDMSPTNSLSLVISANFDARNFVDDDMEDTLKIRELRIKIEEGRARYNNLFIDNQNEE